MILRRRPADARQPEPTVPEVVPAPMRARITAVRAQLRRLAEGADATVTGELAVITDQVERAIDAVVEGATDRRRLDAALADADPTRLQRELKDLVRRLDLEPAASPVRPSLERAVTSVRRRYEGVHRLWDQRDVLDARLEAVILDMEDITARAHELLTLRRFDGSASFDHLRADLEALRLAHAELDAL